MHSATNCVPYSGLDLSRSDVGAPEDILGKLFSCDLIWMNALDPLTTTINHPSIHDSSTTIPYNPLNPGLITSDLLSLWSPSPAIDLSLYFCPRHGCLPIPTAPGGAQHRDSTSHTQSSSSTILTPSSFYHSAPVAVEPQHAPWCAAHVGNAATGSHS